jgi:endonuclease YncB( thermonuclease family)
MKSIAIAACLGLLCQAAGDPAVPRPDGSRVGPGPATILAADTLGIDGSRIRLWGLSLKDSARSCPDYAPEADCLAGAVWELEHLIKDYDVRCDLLGADQADGRKAGRCEVRYDECYGVTCQIRWRDISEELISAGVVVQDRAESGGRYDEVEETARYGASGLWATTDGGRRADAPD